MLDIQFGDDLWEGFNFIVTWFFQYLSAFIFTFLSHTEYGKRNSVVIAWWKKKFSPFDECSCFVCLRRQNKRKKFPSVCLVVWLYIHFNVRTWILAVDAITFSNEFHGEILILVGGSWIVILEKFWYEIILL